MNFLHFQRPVFSPKTGLFLPGNVIVGIIGRMLTCKRVPFLLLCLCLPIVVGCGALPLVASPSPVPVLTPTELSSPAWLDLNSYRVAMVGASADDVQRIPLPTLYHIRASLDLRDKVPHIHGVQTTRYANKASLPLTQVYFRLFPNKPGFGSRLTLLRVAVQNRDAELEYQAQDTAVGVTLPRPLPPGEAVDIFLEYEVTVPVDNVRGYGTFNYQDGVLLLSNFYPMVAVYEPDGWELSLAPDYGDPVYAETSFYTVEFTAPQDMTVIASGSSSSKRENADGTVTWTLVTGPMRDMMVVVSNRLQSTSLAIGYVRVNSYYFPEHKDVGEAVLEYARDSLRAYQQTFGPYPFAEFDVVEAPIYAGGMEYPGLILLARNQYTGKSEYLEFVTAHEVAHQWWYGLVGNDQVNVPWLDESLTNFSTVYYYEYAYGRDRASMVFQNYIGSRYFQAKEAGRDDVVNQPVAAFSPDQYSTIVYGKGAVFFYELRSRLGDGLFLEILRSYLQDRKYQIAKPDDFLRVAEAVSGQELDDFYAKWILQAD